MGKFSNRSRWEDLLLFQIKAMKLPLPVSEHKFHPERKWRFDLAYVDKLLAIEIEGGIWNMGRHVRPSGFINDIEKYNAATLLGWRVLRFDPKKIQNGDAVALLNQVLSKGNGKPAL
jgi:very-short-patch-repair endonuclease